MHANLTDCGMGCCVCNAGYINVEGSQGEIGISGLRWDKSLEDEGWRVILPGPQSDKVEEEVQ